MSLGYSSDEFREDYEALAMATAEENERANWGLPSEVLETMTDYSPSSVGRLPDDIDIWEFYGVDREESPNTYPPPAHGMYPSNQLYLQEQQRYQELEDQLLASEMTNYELTNTVSSISTAHVMVCLERDNLQRFKKVSSCIICIMIIILLLVVLYWLFG